MRKRNTDTDSQAERQTNGRQTDRWIVKETERQKETNIMKDVQKERQYRRRDSTEGHTNRSIEN